MNATNKTNRHLISRKNVKKNIFSYAVIVIFIYIFAFFRPTFNDFFAFFLSTWHIFLENNQFWHVSNKSDKLENKNAKIN